MNNLFRNPIAILVLSFFTMWLSARIGFFVRKKQINLEEQPLQDLDLIVTATLTLLGLIIGFSFSMAINRYDQRKNCEEAEANAIGTEYLRAGRRLRKGGLARFHPSRHPEIRWSYWPAIPSRSPGIRLCSRE
jgi:hypothetical protein